jgi:hypothetical protein
MLSGTKNVGITLSGNSPLQLLGDLLSGQRHHAQGLQSVL